MTFVCFFKLKGIKNSSKEARHVEICKKVAIMESETVKLREILGLWSNRNNFYYLGKKAIDESLANKPEVPILTAKWQCVVIRGD
jgi:hypothetical protein